MTDTPTIQMRNTERCATGHDRPQSPVMIAGIRILAMAPAGPSGSQLAGVMLKMIRDKAGDEIVAVVIAFMPP